MKKILAAALSAALLLTVGLTGCGQANKDAKYEILSESLANEEYVIGFRKTDTALKEEVNKVLSEMKADGSLGEISTKWFGSDVTTVPANYQKAEATDDSLQKVLDKGQLVLGLDDSFPPMGYRDENNDIVGYDIDVATEVCKRLGVELVLQPISWTAKEKEINSGNIDCIWNGFSINPERQEQLCLSMPFQHIDLRLIFIYHIINSRGDGSLSVKRNIIRIGAHICIIKIDIIIANKPASVSTFHYQTVILYGFFGILLCKGRINIRVLFHYLNMFRQAFVLV